MTTKTMSDIIKDSIKNNGEVKEENVESNNECICCKSNIIGKPWITVHIPNEDYNIHACGYMCGKDIKYHIGSGYWNNVVNKEDFNEPRPLIKSVYNTKDITTNFGIDEIRDEIEREEQRSKEVEDEYNNDNVESPLGYYDDY